MPDPKSRAPFKSGVLDHEELYKRIKELGIRGPLEEKGVDVTRPDPEPAPSDPGHYTYEGMGWRRR